MESAYHVIFSIKYHHHFQELLMSKDWVCDKEDVLAYLFAVWLNRGHP
jgi:hypothetical protein